ncbi:MAG: D-Ala-D-Ala carboxypeptidase family metallohydrolase [bacterium]
MLSVKIENFTENEIACKCCGKVNVSDKGLISLQAFRYYLNNKYKKNIRLTVESACRCTKHNNSKEVGGEKNSRHECETKKSDAFDLTSPDLDYKVLYQEAVNSKLFSTIIRYDKKHFVHTDTRPRADYEISSWAWNK